MDLFQWSINFLGGANHNFLVQLCKMMISPGLFLQIFIVQAVRGGWWGERRVKGLKIAQNKKNNNYICHEPYLRNSIDF